VLDAAGDVLTVASVDAISATDWDAIVGPRDLFGSHAWLRHLDEAVAAHEVLTVWTDDRLTAAAPIDSVPGSGGFRIGVIHA
jgi:hypothetical protein